MRGDEGPRRRNVQKHCLSRYGQGWRTGVDGIGDGVSFHDSIHTDMDALSFPKAIRALADGQDRRPMSIAIDGHDTVTKCLPKTLRKHKDPADCPRAWYRGPRTVYIMVDQLPDSESSSQHSNAVSSQANSLTVTPLPPSTPT